MKRGAIFLAMGLVLLGLACHLARQPEDRLGDADRAYRQGEYARAVELYRQSESSRAALGQGAALYRLQRYPEAAGAYEHAAGSDEHRRRARAAHDHGNCALQQACLEGSRDPGLLARAIMDYRDCLQHAPLADAEGLRADARHNLELAKLLLGDPVAAPCPA
jgi:tetratricopeptide (TPR) repeat protein